MASTAGIADLVSSLTSGAGLEAAGYDRAMKRQMDAASAQALLAKRMQDAAAGADQTRYRQNFENVADLPDMVKYAILAGLGGDYSSAMTGMGTAQENDLFEAVVRGIESRASTSDPIDILNQQIGVRGNKLLGPGNVGTAVQSEADIAKTVADTIAASALANERTAGAGANRALEQERLAKIVTTPGGEVLPNMEDVDSITDQFLYNQPPSTLEVKTDNPYWFTGDTIETLPFDDPKAQAAWNEMSQEEREALMVDLNPEFSMWRSVNLPNDPSLADRSMAIGKFLAMKEAQRSAMPARGELYRSADQLAADIAAGRVKSGDTVMTPEGPRVVK